MAIIPVNATGIVSATSVTGSFGGFTVISGSATFTGLRDAFNNVLATSAAPMIIPAGFTIPIFVTSASLSTGSVLFYT
jgi:hypothetical protein